MPTPMPTDFARQAQSILRDLDQFQWYVVPLLALVLYVYAVEIERRNWNVVCAGLAFWGMDWPSFTSPNMHPSGALRARRPS